MTKLDQHIDRMMPELGFTTDDNDRLVASYSGGWQMRMCVRSWSFPWPCGYLGIFCLFCYIS